MKIAPVPEVVTPEQNNRPAIIVIEADDSAYRHACGAMVTPRFDATGGAGKCPRCGQPT